MSWDVSVQRFEKEYESIADIPDTERCVELGSHVEIREVISRFFRVSIGATRLGGYLTPTTAQSNSTWAATNQAPDS